MNQVIGRIYRIVSSECDGVYIGSTTQQLNTRFYKHKNHYKRYLDGYGNFCTSYEIVKFMDAKLELVHEGLFDSKKDMEKFEGETIRTTPNAVNKRMAGRSKQQYCQDNKETAQQYMLQYNKTNHDAIDARQKTKCVCDVCGGKYTLRHKATHFRTNMHRTAASSTTSSSADNDLSESDSD